MNVQKRAIFCRTSLTHNALTGLVVCKASKLEDGGPHRRHVAVPRYSIVSASIDPSEIFVSSSHLSRGAESLHECPSRLVATFPVVTVSPQQSFSNFLCHSPIRRFRTEFSFPCLCRINALGERLPTKQSSLKRPTRPRSDLCKREDQQRALPDRKIVVEPLEW